MFRISIKKGRAYTIALSPEQAEKHGQGIFGDIASKMKKQAIIHKDITNPVISSIKSGATKGVAKLAKAAQDKIETNINTIEGEGLISDALKGLITMSRVGAKERKPRAKKGKGILGSLIKAVAPAVIDAVSGAAKSKVSGMGAKCKPGRPRKVRRPKKRNGGALFAPGVTA